MVHVASASTTLALLSSASNSRAFSPTLNNVLRRNSLYVQRTPYRDHFTSKINALHLSNINTSENQSSNNPIKEVSDADQHLVPNDLGLEIIRGGGSDMTDEMLSDIQNGAPGKWEVMKSLLGINIFTYILAILIAFFLSMNAIYGPGWFGQFLGMENVGSFTQVSDSLPMDIDVSGSEFLL